MPYAPTKMEATGVQYIKKYTARRHHIEHILVLRNRFPEIRIKVYESSMLLCTLIKKTPSIKTVKGIRKVSLYFTSVLDFNLQGALTVANLLPKIPSDIL
jgi:hypothetical protein